MPSVDGGKAKRVEAIYGCQSSAFQLRLNQKIRDNPLLTFFLLPEPLGFIDVTHTPIRNVNGLNVTGELLARAVVVVLSTAGGVGV